MLFRKKAHRKSKKSHKANLGHNRPSEVTSLGPKRGRPVHTRGKSRSL